MTNDTDNAGVQVFKFSRGSKLTVLSAIVIITLLSAFMAVQIFEAHAGVEGAAWVDIHGRSGMCGERRRRFIGFHKYARTAFLEIGPDYVRTVNLFKTASLRFDEAAEMKIVWIGARPRRKHYIRVTPKDPARAPMKISYAYEYMGDVERLLSVAIPGEGAVMARESRAVVYSELAGSYEQKDAALAGIAMQCKWLGAIAVAATIYAIIYPRPYPLVIPILMLLPVAVVFYSRKHGNVVTLGIDGVGSVRPSLFWAFLLPAVALALRAATRPNSA